MPFLVPTIHSLIANGRNFADARTYEKYCAKFVGDCWTSGPNRLPLKYVCVSCYSVQVYFVGPNAKKQQSMLESANNNGYDDDQGSYVHVPHDHVAYRYEVLRMLGKGSFGQVVKVYDHRERISVALKMVLLLLLLSVLTILVVQSYSTPGYTGSPQGILGICAAHFSTSQIPFMFPNHKWQITEEKNFKLVLSHFILGCYVWGVGIIIWSPCCCSDSLSFQLQSLATSDSFSHTVCLCRHSLWPPYVIGPAICIFILWFLLSFFFFFLASLSGRRLIVYHASTHGVALV